MCRNCVCELFSFIFNHKNIKLVLYDTKYFHRIIPRNQKEKKMIRSDDQTIDIKKSEFNFFF